MGERSSSEAHLLIKDIGVDRGTRRGRSTAVAPAPAGIVSGMTSGADPGRAETAELSIDECLRLLGAHRFGRLAVAVGEGVPAIRPLQYAFDARAKSIVMRIGEGSTLHAVTHSAKAAFEIDGVDEPAKTGWSVIVVGVAIVVSSQAEIARLERSDAVAWGLGAPTRWVQLPARTVSGRRITSAAERGSPVA